jgi:diguanylate cyclase (GGDEF)-like protein
LLPSQPTVIDPGLLATIRRHLEGLRRSPDGTALYGLIERGLRHFAGPDGRIELAFVTFLNSILGKFAKDAAHDQATRVKARLIQQRLMLHLPAQSAATPSASPPAARRASAAPEAGAVVSGVPAPSRHGPEPPLEPPAAQEPGAPPTPPASAIPEAPPVTSPHASETAAIAGADPPEAVVVSGSAPPLDPVSTDIGAAAEPIEAESSKPVDLASAAQPPAAAPASPDAGADGAARAAVETLVEKVTESITFNPEFDALLQSQEQALARVDGAIQDFNDLKHLIVRGLDDLIRERAVLKQQLTSAAEQAKSAQVERAELQRQLTKVRKHSFSDELTGLPKRDGFVRSLEAEIGRVRRYGFALTLAIVDIDGLDTINREHGRAAGDAVLRCYSGEVLGNFRAYDVVARYEDDAFAVLFPNTQKDGALRALDKARKRATETFLSHDDRHFALPGFSSVVAVYTPGEKAAALLRRADEALDHAKLKGHGQTVFALPGA